MPSRSTATHAFVLLRPSMTYTCHQKCINAKYADGEMNKGEGVCTDRCVAKFMEVRAM